MGRADQVYGALRERIVTVGLRPGARLIERDLAAEFEVSRIPLREALQRLAADGLVTTVPGQGSIVTVPTPKDIADLFDVRAGLEPVAARLAAANAGPRDLDRLKECVRPRTDAETRTEANAAFHRELVAAARNPLLAQIMEPLEARMRWLFHLTVERDPVRQREEHAELLDALMAPDADRAAAVALAHIEDGRAFTLEAARRWQLEAVDVVEATKTRRRRVGAELAPELVERDLQLAEHPAQQGHRQADHGARVALDAVDERRAVPVEGEGPGDVERFARGDVRGDLLVGDLREVDHGAGGAHDLPVGLGVDEAMSGVERPGAAAHALPPGGRLLGALGLAEDLVPEVEHGVAAEDERAGADLVEDGLGLEFGEGAGEFGRVVAHDLALVDAGDDDERFDPGGLE
ncbi:DNA-binding transcriptional regulator, GntR family [Glycomyces sambucus]|uniref:DNA-binding transcriptional regulator, GntR family n=1 Tax=Glycomyces sambucus TaxID=380244 RepID=A0A1G9LM47_9ACTN|nr:DNA-binding transcriptional regulator, GntR family [Glycomyces sambucus]